MRLTSKPSRSTRFTVRLTPSTQIEPLVATYFASGCGRRKATTPPSRTATSPTPSTWPVTRCPPSLSPRASAFSRFTAPGRSRPAVTRRVSRDTSAANPRPRLAVTVRHTPCTQIESPIATPARSSPPASTSKGSARTMRPTACTMPVNMRRRVAQTSGRYCLSKRLVRPVPEPAEMLVERERGRRQPGDHRTDHQRVRGPHGGAGEVEDERRAHEPHAQREVQPLRGQVVAREALEVRAERQHQADEDRVPGRDLKLGVARQPRRHGEPETKREARPALPLGVHARFDRASIAPVRAGGVVSLRYRM